MVARFLEKDGRAVAELATGEVLPVDVVVAATGWTQDIPFLPADVLEKLHDERGDFLLHRQIHPIDVPDLSFAGYNSSFFSPLSAEVSAIWIGRCSAATTRCPAATRCWPSAARRWTGCASAPTASTPGAPTSSRSRSRTSTRCSPTSASAWAADPAKQWLLPIDPGDYQHVTPTLAKRLQRA